MTSIGNLIQFHLLERLHENIDLNIKLNIILNQLRDVSQNNPDKNITFYFYDDDVGLRNPNLESIFKAFKKYFTEHPEKIPKNITLFLMHFDPYERLKLIRQNITPGSELKYWSNELLNTEVVNHKRIRTLTPSLT